MTVYQTYGIFVYVDAFGINTVNRQADMAQVVERRIGSAEATGPTPVISFMRRCMRMHLFSM